MSANVNGDLCTASARKTDQSRMQSKWRKRCAVRGLKFQRSRSAAVAENQPDSVPNKLRFNPSERPQLTFSSNWKTTKNWRTSRAHPYLYNWTVAGARHYCVSVVYRAIVNKILCFYCFLRVPERFVGSFRVPAISLFQLSLIHIWRCRRRG